MMEKLFRFKLLVVIALAVILLSSFTLVKTHNRDNAYSLPSSVKALVTKETKGMTEKQIIDYSVQFTASRLQFAEANDMAHGKANCVGYAQYCSAVCNHALANNGYRHRSKPVVGYVSNCGVNLCSVLKSIVPGSHWQNFVKNHDFVELKLDDATYYFDPSLYDVLGDNCLTKKDT
ncbi:MAG: hypothetical protein IJT30_01950 [Muribaculaceae bacterium]|nr:hypothetical protein [Muribaculaceae bacterium]